MSSDARLDEAKLKYRQVKAELRQAEADLHVAERKLYDVIHGVRRETASTD